MVAVSEEEANAAEVARDDARRNKLISLISLRDDLPSEKLIPFDLHELEEMWSRGEGSQPAPAKPSTTKASAKSKSKSKVPAKTPKKKVSSALPKESSVRANSLPHNALANITLDNFPRLAGYGSAEGQGPVRTCRGVSPAGQSAQAKSADGS